MTINYNRTGVDRKPLIAAISAITGAEAKYLGAPSFAYQVDNFTVDRSGAVTFDDRAARRSPFNGSCDTRPGDSGAEDARNARSHRKNFFGNFRFWGVIFMPFSRKDD